MFHEDVDVFLDDFAEAVLWDGVEIQAIYTSAYERAGIGELGMAASSPALTMPTASVPVDPVSQLVGVRGVRYSVAEHQPDGTGMSILFLERA